MHRRDQHSRARTTLAAVALWAAVTGPRAAAQDVGPDAAERVVIEETAWSEVRSLALFEACDRDADDRLDILELRRVMVDLRGTRDPAVYRRLDTDHSGFVEWPEFDVRYRLSLDRTGRFRIAPHRAPPDLRDPTARLSDVDPSEQVFAALDGDGDGGLSQREFADFLVRMNRDPGLASRFELLDSDRSGRLELGEFRPMLQFVPEVWERMGESEDLRRAMPEEFRGADRDLNGVIDRADLRAALGRIHPMLTSWTDAILDAADRSRNGSLGAAELVAGRAKAREALEDGR